MHKITQKLLILSMILGVSGCSKTWSGLQQDSTSLWKDTRSVIHEASSPNNTSLLTMNKTKELAIAEETAKTEALIEKHSSKANTDDVKEVISVIE